MFCRCFKVFLFWRKGFLHSESTTCLACTGNRGACSNRGCGWIFNTHSHPAPFSWSSLNAEGWCVRVCVCLSVFASFCCPVTFTWHSHFRRGEGKETRVSLLFLGQCSISGQWASLCLLLCLQPLPCINPSSLNTCFFGGKICFSSRNSYHQT